MVLLISANIEVLPDPVFPLGASYISQALLNASIEHDVVDLCFLKDPVFTLSNVDFRNYKIILISIRNIDDVTFPKSISYMNFYENIINIIRSKNKNAIIIIGGAGPSILPEECFNELMPDYLITGEGEITIIKLIKNMFNNILPDKKIIESESVDLANNLVVQRDKFDLMRYLQKGGCINIQTRRGCSFKCIYCSYPFVEGRCIRFRNIYDVVNEIKYLKTKGINHYFFVDNVFNYPEEYAMELANAIINNKLNIKLSVYSRPIVKNRMFFKLMKQAGMESVDFGTDACNDKMLYNLGKDFRVKDISHAHKLAYESNIKINHSIILGGPGETLDTMNNTFYNLNILHPTSVICMLGIRIYKNTSLYKHCLINEEILEDDGGLKPYFYISQDVENIIIPFAEKIANENANWVIPGLQLNYPLNYIKRQREKGMKGQIWELFN